MLDEQLPPREAVEAYDEAIRKAKADYDAVVGKAKERYLERFLPLRRRYLAVKGVARRRLKKAKIEAELSFLRSTMPPRVR